MNLTEWARAQGVAPRTAYRWFREGTLPVAAERVGPRMILVNIDANTSPSVTGGVGLYARVSSREQKAGHKVVRVESAIASGVNGARARACRLLADPAVTTVVERRGRLGRGNVELVEAALAAAGRRLVVLDDGEVEVEDGLVRDMVEVSTSLCARRYGRRSAKNRATKALEAAAADG
ncbi:IS607 family transposase [Streptomyces sp. NPDC057684]|uniref:IS607 family transposase n=1 Tax=Streptomyces sp. NPDC057684 TaxID=3346211 RepID=UPI0036CAE557